MKLTVPLKLDPLLGATVMDAVRLFPAIIVVGVIDPADMEKPFRLAAQVNSRLLTSTDPSPVTRL